MGCLELAYNVYDMMLENKNKKTQNLWIPLLGNMYDAFILLV